MDKISTNLGFNLFPRNLPKNRAIELLKTIPQIEPRISDILYPGYFTPKPSEAKKVLSPNSPIIILKATTKMPFVFNLEILFKKPFFDSSIFPSFLGINPKIPNSKKER